MLALAGLRPADLHPGYPGLVMGTGSLSSGALLLGMPGLSAVLFAVAAAAFALLCVLAALRLAAHGGRLRADAEHPRTMFAFYTFPSAVAVLGVRAALDGWRFWPAVALIVGIAATLALAVPGLRVVRSSLGNVGVVTGNWQLPSVAIEALALLATILAVNAHSEISAVVAVALWVVGIGAYAAVVPAIIRRFRRLPWGPADLTPDYWTPMAVPSLIGLVAARLWSASPAFEGVAWLRGAYEPAAIIGLSISAGLAPVWIALQIWRLARDPLSRRYSPAWWGLVFPTAIVVVAARVIGTTFDVRWLRPAARVSYWVVFAAWVTVGVGLVRNLVRREVVEPAMDAPGASEPAPAPTV